MVSSYWDSPVSGGYSLRIMATLVSQDTSTNRSRVRFEQWLLVGTGRFLSNIACSTQGYINGQTPLNYSGPISVSGPENRQLTNTEVWVDHNSDGTGSVIVTGYFQAPGYVSQLSIVNQSMPLPTIARATKPTVPAMTTGVSAMISLPRSSSLFTHDVTYLIGTKSGTIATGAGVTASWTPPHDLATEFPAAASRSIEITVVTRQGGTQIGSAEKRTVTLTAGESVKPTVSAVTWADSNTTVNAQIGAFVQGLSQITGTVTAAGIYGSTISARRFRIGSTVFPQGSPIVISGSGSVAAKGEAVDSRGRVGEFDAPFTVLAYAPPTLGSGGWKVRRATVAGVPADDGTRLRLDLHAVAASLIVGTEKNGLTIAIRTRKQGTETWTARNSITAGILYNTNVLITGAYPITESHDVEVSLTDKTGTVSRLVTVVTSATVTLDLHGNAVGVGKMHEQGALDVAGEIYAGGLRVLTEYERVPIGAAVDFAGATAPSGWLLCNGGEVSRTTYAALFAAIGTAFGAGNGTDTFNLPRAGRIVVSRDPGQTEFDTLGEIGGAKSHILTRAQTPTEFGHRFAWGSSGGTVNVQNAVVQAGATSGNRLFTNQNTDGWGPHTGGEAFSLLPPIEVWNRIIRAS